MSVNDGQTSACVTFVLPLVYQAAIYNMGRKCKVALLIRFIKINVLTCPTC